MENALRALILASLFVVAAAQAHAAIIYNWVPSGADPGGAGQVIFEDNAFADGTASFHSSLGTTYGPAPGSDIISFAWGQHGISASFHKDGYVGGWNMQFTLDGTGLTGGVLGSDTSNSVSMDGVGALWTVTHFASDGPNPCHASENDCGATGYWQRAGGPSQSVAEPFSLTVMLSGVAGLAVLRRRRTHM
jgi:hypothetical protein